MMLETGTDVNHQNDRRETALITATNNTTKGRDNSSVMKLLLRYGADVSIESRASGTALQIAVKAGNPNVVDFLLENGADVNYGSRRYGSVLHTAISYEDYSEVETDNSEKARRQAVIDTLLAHGAQDIPFEESFWASSSAVSDSGDEEKVTVLWD
jgi:ankyrin repeat protein